MGSVHGEMRSLLCLLVRVGERDIILYDNIEQVVSLLGDFVLGEGNDQLHHGQSRQWWG